MMITSSFLSMWLSNSATTAMMLPIANAILESLFGDLETLKERCKITDDPEGMKESAVIKEYIIAIHVCIRIVSYFSHKYTQVVLRIIMLMQHYYTSYHSAGTCSVLIAR